MMHTFRYIITGYLIVMNIIAFAAIGTDKRRAVKKVWRIPERTLLLTAIAGGGIGALFGMYGFRHKTKHLRFIVLIPVSALFCLGVILNLYGII